MFDSLKADKKIRDIPIQGATDQKEQDVAETLRKVALLLNSQGYKDIFIIVAENARSEEPTRVCKLAACRKDFMYEVIDSALLFLSNNSMPETVRDAIKKTIDLMCKNFS